MDFLEMHSLIKKTFDHVQVDAVELNSFPHLVIDKNNLKTILSFCYHDKSFSMDFLETIVCNETESGMQLIYVIYSSIFSHHLTFKVNLENNNNTKVSSIAQTWASAETFEHEIYELFGVEFEGAIFNQPLFLTQSQFGLEFPLRKKYNFQEVVDSVQRARPKFSKEHKKEF